MLNRGSATFTQFIADDLVHVTLEVSSTGFKIERIFDPDKNMATLYSSTYSDHQLLQEMICDNYVKSNSGHWHPLIYTENRYASVGGEAILTFSETFEAIPDTVEFNIPIKSSLFSVKYPENAVVIDERYDPPLQFIFRRPDLEVILEPLEKSISPKITIDPNNGDSNSDNSGTGKLIQDSNTLIRSHDKAIDSNVGTTSHKTFIPNAIIALNHRNPVIFDLSVGILLYTPERLGSKELDSALFKIGKGDIAWDGSLLTLRKSKAFSISKESHRLLICKSEELYNSYKLPENLYLPYSLLVVTNEVVNFLVTISKIEPEGIWITYKRLCSDEANRYYPIARGIKGVRN